MILMNNMKSECLSLSLESDLSNEQRRCYCIVNAYELYEWNLNIVEQCVRNAETGKVRESKEEALVRQRHQRLADNFIKKLNKEIDWFEALPDDAKLRIYAADEAFHIQGIAKADKSPEQREYAQEYVHALLELCKSARDEEVFRAAWDEMNRVCEMVSEGKHPNVQSHPYPVPQSVEHYPAPASIQEPHGLTEDQQRCFAITSTFELLKFWQETLASELADSTISQSTISHTQSVTQQHIDLLNDELDWFDSLTFQEKQRSLAAWVFYIPGLKKWGDNTRGGGAFENAYYHALYDLAKAVETEASFRVAWDVMNAVIRSDDYRLKHPDAKPLPYPTDLLIGEPAQVEQVARPPLPGGSKPPETVAYPMPSDILSRVSSEWSLATTFTIEDVKIRAETLLEDADQDKVDQILKEAELLFQHAQG